MKLLVTGNCQARPIASMMAASVHGLEVFDPIVLHLSNVSQAQEHEMLFEQADLILAQNTVDSFKPEHLASARLKSDFPEKTIVWPNIFYAGQQPYLRYITHTTKGRVMGPFDAYHDLRILEEWYRERSIEFTFSVPEPEAVHLSSIAELMAKETSCDLIISDLVEKFRGSEPLFFSFNHPMNFLLGELCRRFANEIGKEYKANYSLEREPLSRYIMPSLWHKGPMEEVQLQGVVIDFSLTPFIAPGPPRPYSFKEARELLFACYDHQQEILVDTNMLRLTPNIAIST